MSDFVMAFICALVGGMAGASVMRYMIHRWFR